MRFGQDEPALLKPEDNGGLTEAGGETEGSEGSMVVYDLVEDKYLNATKA